MRNLASIRKITEIFPIEGADSIEGAVVGGWKVVVRKGEFHIGELAIYCEIDSFIPNKIAPLLTKPGQRPNIYQEVEGERLKTVTLRGQLSQGLLLPLSILNDSVSIADGEDVTEILGIKKWEPEIPESLRGLIKGDFPVRVPKTEQPRIQNLATQLQSYIAQQLRWEVTEKLDGASCTFYLSLEGDFEVCSHTISLQRNETNAFWKMAMAGNVENRMLQSKLLGYAIQGELIGRGVERNRYQLPDEKLFIFDIYDVKQGKYLTSTARKDICDQLGLNHIPVIDSGLILDNSTTVESILKYAEGKSALNAHQEREGAIFKCLDNPDLHFKAVSNRFLLKNNKEA